MAQKVFIALLFLLIFSCKPNKKKPNCKGKDRWDVKTLTDASQNQVHYSPLNTTVSTLINIPLNVPIEGNTSRFGVEFYTYSVRCKIREYKLSDDGDYHLVLMDLTDASKTMIGEIPDENCASVQLSPHLAEFIQARKDFQNSLLSTGQVDTSVYTITGVAFFDKVHGQLGAAPTAIEIHPVLSIKKE